MLFDVYLTWARVEKAHTCNSDGTASHALSHAPIIVQYLFFLTMNTLATLAQHSTVRLLVRLFFSKTATVASVASPAPPMSGSPDKEDTQRDGSGGRPSSAEGMKRTIGPGRASPSAISTALLVSSCTKLFPILLVIWRTEPENGDCTPAPPTFASRARSYVGWAVLLNNIEALLILLDCGYAAATGLALAGSAARWLVEGIILETVGLDGDGGPVGDLSALVRGVAGWFRSA